MPRNAWNDFLKNNSDSFTEHVWPKRLELLRKAYHRQKKINSRTSAEIMENKQLVDSIEFLTKKLSECNTRLKTLENEHLQYQRLHDAAISELHTCQDEREQLQDILQECLAVAKKKQGAGMKTFTP